MARFESKIIGIDLGTTNTLVSYYDEIAKRGECCISREGGSLTPSAVFFENADSYIVGMDAKDCAILYPDRTALYFKRLMGETKKSNRYRRNSIFSSAAFRICVKESSRRCKGRP